MKIFLFFFLFFSFGVCHGDSGVTCKVVSSYDVDDSYVADVACRDSQGSMIYNGQLSQSDYASVKPASDKPRDVDSSKLTSLIVGGNISLYKEGKKISNPLASQSQDCHWTSDPISGTGQTEMATEGHPDYINISRNDTTDGNGNLLKCQAPSASLPASLTGFCHGQITCENNPSKDFICESYDGGCPNANQCAKLGAPPGVATAEKPSFKTGESLSNGERYSQMSFPNGSGVCVTNTGSCLATSCTSDKSCTADPCVNAKAEKPAKKDYPNTSNGGNGNNGNSGQTRSGGANL